MLPWKPSSIFTYCAVKTNDMMLVIYLSSLIRSVIALHNLINNKASSLPFHQIYVHTHTLYQSAHNRSLLLCKICFPDAKQRTWEGRGCETGNRPGSVWKLTCNFHQSIETSVVLGVEGTSYLFVGFLIDDIFCFILLEEMASFPACIFLIIFCSMFNCTPSLYLPKYVM